MTSEVTLWLLFGASVGVMLVLDLGIFHRKAHIIKVKEALIWSAIWITLALLFNLGIYVMINLQRDTYVSMSQHLTNRFYVNSIPYPFLNDVTSTRIYFQFLNADSATVSLSWCGT